jgi:hypothetical protein
MRLSLTLTLLVLSAAPLQAQVYQACPHQAYRLVYETVYDEREVTAYRVQHDTVYEERQVTSYRPVWETEMRERRYTVARPVQETSEREERYTVMRPVWETSLRDASYDRVRNVLETAEREERYTVMKPVWETSEREERYTVRRAVMETAERDEFTTVCEPVTTYRTQYVDQGGYVDQCQYTPGAVRNRLTWQPAACVVDPLTGASTFQRGGLAWVPMQQPGAYQVARVWQPNVVAQQVPQTTSMCGEFPTPFAGRSPSACSRACRSASAGCSKKRWSAACQ